ncbi:hypothetical protein FP515_13750 [Geobacillus thermoleovorans]|nr:hypothetical protein FP515_13750 [Geobacillus thermoleovorans]
MPPSRQGVTEDRTTGLLHRPIYGSGSGVVRSPDSRSNTREKLQMVKLQIASIYNPAFALCRHEK